MTADQTKLIELATSGDQLAVEVLLVETCGWLIPYIRPRVPLELASIVSVDDIVQEVLVEVFGAIRGLEFRGEEAFRAWIISIANHRVQNIVRYHRAVKRGGGMKRFETQGTNSSAADLAHLLADTGETPSHPFALNEVVSAIHVGLDGMSSTQRTVLQLRYLDGKSLESTADELRRSPAAVRGLLHRAKASLRAAMGRSSRWFAKR